jgi:hypothetical protein
MFPSPPQVIPINTTLYPISFAQSLTLLQGLGFKGIYAKAKLKHHLNFHVGMRAWKVLEAIFVFFFWVGVFKIFNKFSFKIKIKLKKLN